MSLTRRYQKELVADLIARGHAAQRPAAASSPSEPDDPAARRRRVELEVARRCREFDLVALAEILAWLGYRREEIIFESNPSAVTQHGIVFAVEFRAQPMRMAVVTLNMGLLGPQSPLPSYFQKTLESGDVDEEGLETFLGYFDHVALQATVEAAYPESNTQIYRDWEQTKRRFVTLLGLRSLSTHHWLFQIVYPELGVTVDRGTHTRNVRVDAARLGSIILGGAAALGGITKVPVPGFDVNLYTDDETTPAGRPWAEEVGRRLQRIVFPVLRDADIDMKVSLTIRSQRGWLRIGPGSYLGFDRMKGGADRNRVIVVHRGPVPAS